MLQILKQLVRFGNMSQDFMNIFDRITQLTFKYKQATIIILTHESTYMVVPHATKEAIWHK